MQLVVNKIKNFYCCLIQKKLPQENMELKEKGYAIKEMIIWQLSTFYLFCEFCEMWYSFLSVITLENKKLLGMS